MSDQWGDVELVAKELILGQQKRLLKLARQIVPYVTSDDILQPNDYEELENHPHFRYEEGVLAGMQALQSALFARQREQDEVFELKN